MSIAVSFSGIGSVLASALLVGSALADDLQRGPVRVVGSPTVIALVEAWAEPLASRGIVVRADARGSSTGPPALLAGSADLAAMTRTLSPAEREAFRNRLGREPVGIPVAVDALGIFVNTRNPIERLTLPQLDGVFSANRRCGGPRALRTWGDLGVGGEWSTRLIGPYGQDKASDAHSFMLQVGLCGGVFRGDVRDAPGADSLTKSLAEAEYGIGYGRLANVPAALKPLSLAHDSAGPYHSPDPAAVTTGTYPLSRVLLLYVSEPTNPPALDLLRYALSDAGQRVVRDLGYLPAPSNARESVDALR